ncbi:MAG: FkbM family methyltransferase [Nitrospira sp.]|nr:FkbM family methyltransferase [Nitrospira sp.]
MSSVMTTGPLASQQRRGYWKLGLVLLSIAVMAVVAGIIVVRSWFPAAWFPVHFLVMKVEGRVDSRCSLDLALESRRHRDETSSAEQKGRAYAKVVDRDAGLTRWQTPYGPVWTSPRDEDGARTAGLFYESSTIRWARIDGSHDSPIRQGDVVVDAGAHSGESTWAALQLGAKLVITIEPDPDNLAVLRRNLAREIADGRVILIDKGVSDREGTLRFFRANSRAGRFENGPDHHHEGESMTDEVALPVTTIDQLVRDHKLTKVDFIKMDIEGAEVPALHGARDTIQRYKPRMAIGTYHRPDDLVGIENVIRAYRSDYQVMPSRCLEGYLDGQHLFPLLLYFS